MDRKEFTKKLKETILAMGADMVGVAPVSRFDGMPHMLHPCAHLPEAKSVICLGVHHPDASVEWCGEPNPNWPEAFQIGMIPKLDSMCYKITRMLEKEGYATIAQPTTTYWRHRKYKDIPYEHTAAWNHMPAFVLAGLGEYGYHGMVMSPEYGPRERIISVITEADLEPDPLYNGDPLCDQCKLCAKVCVGRNYEEDRLNDPKYIEFEVEGKKFKYPNINRWRCFWGEQAHLDTNKLARHDKMDEFTIYKEIETGTRVINEGYMCASFKYCMTKKKRAFDKSYCPGARRKKELTNVSKEEMLNQIIKYGIEEGAEKIYIAPVSEFVECKKYFPEGFRTDQFFDYFKTVVIFGKNLHDYQNDGTELGPKNERHVGYPQLLPMTIALMNSCRYLDEQGYDAIQSWDQNEVARAAAVKAGWIEEGQKTYAYGFFCNIDFESQNRTIREWDDNISMKLDVNHPVFEMVDKIAVNDIEGITYPGIKAVKESYPKATKIVALASQTHPRLTELACKQEAEDGAGYAFEHYMILQHNLQAAVRLCKNLEAKGYFAIALPNLAPDTMLTIGVHGRHMPDLRANAPFAVAAGLGVLGKSGLVLDPEYGSRLRSVFVLTNAPLENTEHETVDLCPAGCTACSHDCPMQALSSDDYETVTIREGESYQVMKIDDVRCGWARSLAMCEGAGSSQTGWILPDIPVPDKLDEETIQRVLKEKDKIQTLCYQNPNFTDVIVERCLQACPINKK